MKKSFLLIVLFTTIFAIQFIFGQAPPVISYQGILTDADGNLVPDGSYALTFKLYEASTGGPELWSESKNVEVKDGIFNVILGSDVPLDFQFFTQFWLGVSISTDPELTPRIQLTSSAYSLNARFIAGGSNIFPWDGNVGIGISEPNQKLHVAGLGRFDVGSGTINLSTPGGWPGLIVSTAQNHRRDIIFDDPDPGSGYKGGIRLLTSTSDSPAPASNGITITEDGDVGIGTSFPDTKLTVNGTIHSTAGGIQFPDGTVQNSAATGGGTDNSWTRDVPNGEVELTNVDDLVGIGTDSPQQKLHVAGIARFDVRTDAHIDLSTPGGWPGVITLTPGGHRRDIIFDDPDLGTGYKGGIRLLTSSSSGAPSAQNGITIDEDGNVGIATSFPDGKLDIDFGATGSIIAGTPLGNGSGWIMFSPNGNRRDIVASNLGLYIGASNSSGATLPHILVSEEGRVGIGMAGVLPSNILQVVQNSTTDPIADAWTTYSSRRWKTNISTIKGALEKVKSLRGVCFDWKTDGAKDIGLIAEEVGEVIPEVVAYEDNGEDAISVDYARLVAVLIEGIKEQEKKIQQQQETIETLIERVTILEEKYQQTSK